LEWQDIQLSDLSCQKGIFSAKKVAFYLKQGAGKKLYYFNIYIIPLFRTKFGDTRIKITTIWSNQITHEYIK